MSAKETRPRAGSRIALVLCVLLLMVIAAWLPTMIFKGGGDAGATLPPPYSTALIARGEYLAKVGDCAACHTSQGGKPFAGGLPVQSPIGVIYSSNITPDPQTGIGKYTYGEFERAVRRGVNHAGNTLYPAMPYPSYARVSGQDVQALYAYFMKGVQPVSQPNRKNGIPWPLSLRWPLAYWRWVFSPGVPEVTVSSGSAPAGQGTDLIARGAYLVEGLGHCGACHTPRSVTMQEEALTPLDGPSYLAGSEVDNWVAPSLRGNAADGLAGMSQDELVALLRSGRNTNSAVFGGMSDVVHHSTQYMTDADLAAVAAFLKSLTVPGDEKKLTYNPSISNDLYKGDVRMPGAQLYVDNCATCHRTTGHGYDQAFPALALNPVVNSTNPDSLIHIVLTGSTMPGTKTAPTEFSMPSFASRLTDDDVAQLLTFVRSSWGNTAPAVTKEQVRKIREQMPKSSNATMTDYDPRNRTEPQ
ncbi:cytochrome c [Burkholderia multivorans]|uniref:cytochrome c n=1 Tax=Burkholderia multivorans TaxID=87883 RepID=UPI001C96335C|nr:cytochrome c [Burkholderia multivorans]MBY4673923.1 cytochrome c [Burkholderia multivorans]